MIERRTLLYSMTNSIAYLDTLYTVKQMLEETILHVDNLIEVLKQSPQRLNVYMYRAQ